MPAAPKPKSKPGNVLVWNRASIDTNGQFRGGNVILNYQDAGTDGRPTAVIHPITVGLAEVPAHHLDRAMADAELNGPDHPISKFLAERRLIVGVDLSKMDLEEAKRAVDQTASKAVLLAIIEGRIAAPDKLREHAAEVKKTWGTKPRNTGRVIVEHFASYSRAG